MTYTNLYWEDIYATVGLSRIEPQGGAAEFHATVNLTDKNTDTATQYRNLEIAAERIAALEMLCDASLVLKRYFVSDAVNQAGFLHRPETSPTAISIVQQPPLNGTKAAMWLYFVVGGRLESSDGATVLNRSGIKHIFNAQLHDSTVSGEHGQTTNIFRDYTASLNRHGCTLRDNCIRTWIYVQGVDVHYAGMVDARTDCFTAEGLNESTHYIASTGIEGRYTDPKALVLMDAYAVAGIDQSQIGYLYAPTHLNPTYEYGVTFERGTTVDYGDRRHIFISGTASIDNKGEIVHPFQINRQVERTIENVGVLLAETGAAMDDIAQMTVYLRDTADYEIVSGYLESRYPSLPKTYVWAPVCRPGWLVEIECIAVKEINTDFAPF